MTKLSIIIVNYNSEKWLTKLFDSINLQTFDYEVIFIDNHSTQRGWENHLKTLHASPNVIRLDNNIGFGGACNIGARNANGKILLFLNPDTSFGDGIFEIIYNSIENGSLDLASPRILSLDGIDPFEGRDLSIDFYGYVGLSKQGPFYIEGSALAISKINFFDIGMFDEDYFMYSEDIDLSWRARLFGLKIGVIKSISVNHYSGGSDLQSVAIRGKKYSTPIRRRFEVEKNNISNLLKLYAGQTLALILPLTAILTLFEVILYAMMGERKAIQAIASAWLWNIKNLEKTLVKRRQVQKRRTLPDSYIIRNMSGAFPNKIKSLARIGLPKFVD